MMSPEIITLQLGSFANYVGAHFWNLQDEAIASSQLADWSSVATSIDHGVLCSWSEDRHGVASYCPRTVVVDLSGALGGVSFSPESAEAAASLSCGTWSGAVEVHSLGRAAKSTFRQHLEAATQLDTGDDAALAAQQQALEDAALALQEGPEPKYWTDYLQVDLHPGSTLTLRGAWQGVSELDGWGPPVDTASSRETAESAVEQVRWWAEKCDRMQGLQILSDDLAGWGSLSLSIVQELQEQYPAQPMLYFSMQQQQRVAAAAAAAGSNQSSSRATRRLLSQCLSVSEISQLVGLYVPLTPPADLPGSSSSSVFQTAALLAAGIETATLPFRCSGTITDAGADIGSTDMHSLVHLLTGPGANLAAMSLQLPAGFLDTNTAAGTAASGAALSINGSGSSSSYVLTEGVLLTAQHCLAESLTLRGARSGGCIASSSQAKQALDTLLLQRQQASTGLMPCLSHTCISPMPVALPLSFPRWLGVVAAPPAAGITGTSGGGSSGSSTQLPSPWLSRPGLAAAMPAPAALSRLTATSSFEGLLKNLERSFHRSCGAAAGKMCLDEWGYSAGDAEELGERLIQLAGQYSTDLD